MRTECFNVGRKDGVVNVFYDTAYRTFLVAECLFYEGFTQRMLRTEQLDGAGTCQHDVIFIAQQGFGISFQQVEVEEPEEVFADKHHLYIHGLVICFDKLFVGTAHGAPVFYFRITALQFVAQQDMTSCPYFAGQYVSAVCVFHVFVYSELSGYHVADQQEEHQGDAQPDDVNKSEELVSL